MTTLRISIFILLALSISVSGAMDTVLLMDDSGSPLGNLPLLKRGEEQLIPSALLTRKANWQREREANEEIITAPGSVTILRRGNPFAKVNDSHIQLRVAPEEWDGSFWLPLSGLQDMFPGGLTYNAETGALQVKMGAPEAEEVVPEPTPEKRTKIGSTEAWKLGTVIIDPGHGGKDPGASGLYDLVEKNVTLDIAKRVARELREAGIDVKLTRDTDRFMPLKDRSEFANANRGDLFVSIHANSFRDASIGGFECYFLSPARTERAVEVALKENAVVELESSDHEYQELTEANHILLTMATAQYMKDSETWAGLTLDEAKEKAGLSVRGLDQAGFYVLMGASMPAILIECGFLTNPADARVLSAENGRQRLSESIATAVLKMKRNMEATASR
ncbi:N-acetylmuramoyl-L-alanine amidase [bacterium]|nr:N-acetylmuramoyl-L-alanine amidase [bacterium]MBU1638359.1 N-acetylmuramoyl-L-alanine amidase [bacterium]MBU1920301.1 N-acetylmuramoyl-L-alanine amidase [bacterium]